MAIPAREDVKLLDELISHGPENPAIIAHAVQRFNAILRAERGAYAARMGLAIAGLLSGDRAPALEQCHALYNLRQSVAVDDLINAARVLLVIGRLDQASEIVIDMVDRLNEFSGTRNRFLMLDLVTIVGHVPGLAKIAASEWQQAEHAATIIDVLRGADLLDRFAAVQSAVLKVVTQEICYARSEIFVDDEGERVLTMYFRANAPLDRRRAIEKAARRAAREVFAELGGMTPEQRMAYHVVVGDAIAGGRVVAA